MPRENKTAEMVKWVTNQHCYIFKVEFKWDKMNNTIAVISLSESLAKQYIEFIYSSAEKIELVAIIESVKVPQILTK